MHHQSEALAKQGYANWPGLLSQAECESVSAHIDAQPLDGPGTRHLLSQAWCRDLARRIRTVLTESSLLAPSMAVVQCTLFEKASSKNWLVPVHQDLSIPVSTRTDAPSWRGWSEKEGHLFAQPPVPVLESLLAVRLHIDPCGPMDGPLRIVPGSHTTGLISPESAVQMRKAEATCTANPGDAILMRPLALHSSSKSVGSSRRRVLHYLFGPRHLPDGVKWQDEA
jgi:hypothetical protein